MIPRRVLFSTPLLSMPLLVMTARAQAAPRRIAVLALTARAIELLREYLLPELARRNLREGASFTLEPFVAGARLQPQAAAEAVRRAPDAIVAISGPAIEAARQATTTIPIVMFGADFRVLAGTSMARPGSNTTGVALNTVESEVKRVELAAELTPDASVVGVLFYRDTIGQEQREAAMRRSAEGIGRALRVYGIGEAGEFRAALAAMRRDGVGAVVLGGTPETLGDIRLLAAQAREAGIATVCLFGIMVEEGCMLSHGPSIAAIYQRIGHHLALVLRGVAPADIPIEAPTRVETVINLRIAEAIGLAVPIPVLARADLVLD
ncbi:ABC transporter substrate-binding protein [Falsiroseomonas sp.]|uniref:ABC transporter substrate-binding protein n=1 Tax=Falsiroseomonas sp. TaxID=2870721 RepID=UPI00356A779B